MLQPTVSKLFVHIAMNVYTDIHAYPDTSCGVLFFAEMISIDAYTCWLRPRQIPSTEQMFHAESPFSPAATHIQLGKGRGAP